MTMLVLVASGRGEVVLSARAAKCLAALGISHVALLQDDEGAAVVLEGWAFDPNSSPGEVLIALGLDGPVRALQPVFHTSVRTE